MPNKKQSKITVKEIREIEPSADIYELSPYSRYLVTVRKSEFDIGGVVAQQKARVIMQTLSQAQIPCVVLIGMNDDVKFMELGE